MVSGVGGDYGSQGREEEEIHMPYDDSLASKQQQENNTGGGRGTPLSTLNRVVQNLH